MIDEKDNSLTAPTPTTFWLRTLAKLADLLVFHFLELAFFILLALLPIFGVHEAHLLWGLLVLYGLLFIGHFAFWNSGDRQTLGYRLAGIHLRTWEQKPVGWWRSLGRTILNTVFLVLTNFGIGLLAYLPIALTPRKQAAHDLAAKTMVLRLSPPRTAALALCAIASIAAPYVIVFGIILPFFLQSFYMPSPSMMPTLHTNDHFLVDKLYYRLRPIGRDNLVVFRAPPEAGEGDTDFIKRVVGLPGERLQVVSGKAIIGGTTYGHTDIRDKMLMEGYFGQAASSRDMNDLMGNHHVKFVSEGVFADRTFITKARLAAMMTGIPDAHVAIQPGYVLCNGKRLDEPFVAEDPDFDLKIIHGQALKYDPSQASGYQCKLNGKVISQAEYDRDDALPTEPLPAQRLFMMGDNRNDSKDTTEWGPLDESRIVGKAIMIYAPRTQDL